MIKALGNKLEQIGDAEGADLLQEADDMYKEMLEGWSP